MEQLGGLAAENFFEQSNAWCDSVGNVMLSIVVVCEFFLLCSDMEL